MIVYKNSAAGFCLDVDRNAIADLVEESILKIFGRKTNHNEKIAFRNSLPRMESVIRRAQVADDCGVMIEYTLPGTSKRIDFVISGHDEQENKKFVIVELKQWESANATEKEGIVETIMRGALVETTHPSYQSQSYKLYLQDFNENIQSQFLTPLSCAYLHNYTRQNPEPLLEKIYDDVTTDTPLYFQDDSDKLAEFISQHVGKGNGLDIMYEIESGKIRPSKKLIEHVSQMFEGNKAFILLDEQKLAYEEVLFAARKNDQKTVVIVNGGPGTGKSVISINVLGQLLKEEKNAVFVAPNAAFREVMMKKLSGKHTQKHLKNLFKGSAGFVDTTANSYDVILVDEAHRLKDKTAYQYRGENQVDDIIRSAKVSVFFVDDNQMIRPDDIGSIEEIERVATSNGAVVEKVTLKAQFRCSGADGYVNWLDDVLHIQQTGNYDGWEDKDFEFKIFEDPNKLREAIKDKSSSGFESRMLAGYAWTWTSAKGGNNDGQFEDVTIPEFDFRMPWNSRKIGAKWAIDPAGIDQVGCIHTSQGLEFDYVGVVVGNDLEFDSNDLKYKVDWNSYKDSSGKKGLKEDPEKLSRLVRNIYKTLMTRGAKGCYVYFCNDEVRQYFESRLSSNK